MKIDTHKHRKGQALVEAAFVLFIVVLFTFAITEFGRAMYIKNMLNNAARAGARQAVVTGSLPVSQPLFTFSNTRPADPVLAKIYDGLMYVKYDTVTASVSCVGCAGSYAAAGDTISVIVTAPFDPVIRLFNDPVNHPKLVITDKLVGQASMRYE